MVGIVLATFGVIFERVYKAVRRPVDAFKAWPARVRSITLIMTSITLLLLVGTFLANQAVNYIRENRNPPLEGQIPIPHGLDTRLAPSRDVQAAALVPEQFGPYRRLAQKLPPNAITNPVISCLIYTQPGEEPLLEPTPIPTATIDPNAPTPDPNTTPTPSPTATPTLTPTATPTVTPSPTPTLTPTLEPGVIPPTPTVSGRWQLEAQAPCRPGAYVTSRAYGRYMVPDTSDMIDLAVVRYPDESMAIDAMFDLLNMARSEGNVGDFAIAGVTTVDFFYGAANRTATFTWRRGPWIFAMSARRYNQLEAAVEAFPY